MIPFMLNCHDATALMSKGRDEELTLGEKMKIRFHASMCSGCTNFERQLEVLGDTAREYAQEGDTSGPESAEGA
jgi:hypothetical protein